MSTIKREETTICLFGHPIDLPSDDYPQLCKEYCCADCPDRFNSPCQKEIKFGLLFTVKKSE